LGANGWNKEEYMRIVQERSGTWGKISGSRIASVLAVAGLLFGAAACGQNAGGGGGEEPAAEAPAGGAALVTVDNLEAVTTQYIVANPTNVYNNHFVYDTEVVGEVNRGDMVEVLGKVPGYEWVLLGQGGEPFGYVPISMLSPADLYVP
jgi:hypothetical protein